MRLLLSRRRARLYVYALRAPLLVPYFRMISLSPHYVSLVAFLFYNKLLHSVHPCSWPFSQHSEVKGGPQRARTRTIRAVGVSRNSAARECASPEIREDAPHFITNTHVMLHSVCTLSGDVGFRCGGARGLL